MTHGDDILSHTTPEQKTIKSKVQINYRSGISMVIECTDFTITRGITGLKSYEWENAEPNPILIGADDIESVWQLS